MKKRTKEQIERARWKAENDPWVVKLRALVAKGEADLKAKREAGTS